ncbi:MAG: 4Fe-4S dicluster domain-containing protein [Candidatus Omnitrophota bacterium]
MARAKTGTTAKSAKKIYCDILKCVGCKACEIACAVEHSGTKNIFGAVGESVRPQKRVNAETVDGLVISLHCQHCADAPCVTACMSGALSKDKKTGATIQDPEKCVGCWMCVMTCPFGAIHRDVGRHIAVKCDLCPDREEYACVAACPTGALFAGTEADFKKTLDRLKEKGEKS